MAKKRRGNGQGTLFKRQKSGVWIASWYDHNGKRVGRSTGTTDKAAAERILSKRVADVALRIDGIIDASKDKYAVEGRKPLQSHINDYIDHCNHIGLAKGHIYQKIRELKKLQEKTGATRLSDLNADTMERYLHLLRDSGLANTTVNFARRIAVAFMSWMVRIGRVETNSLQIVPRLDEHRDRRRVRRPLSDTELSALFEVAEAGGRKAWYMAALFAGLRKGDLQRLRWCDINFVEGSITISEGKAKRTDIIPLHPQLADELKRLHDESMGLPQTRVFPTTVTDRTRQKDFLRAGLAREVVITGDDGKPLMIGKGNNRRPKTRIETIDDDGRIIDLHAMRTTFGTKLAQAGIAPQIAQKLMRHSDYRTTLQHYTVLGLCDTARAIETLPEIKINKTDDIKANGTNDL